MSRSITIFFDVDVIYDNDLAALWKGFYNGDMEIQQTETKTNPPAENPPGTNKVSWRRFLLETAETILLALILYLAIDSVVARVRVENISMEPTLLPDEFILVSKMAYRLGSIQHGDVIVFHYSPTEDYIKRVIGVPGDVVEISHGQVFVNGQLMDEPYIAAHPDYVGRWEVPSDKLFVLGDNRNRSQDSHVIGFISINDVVGKALVIYWPIDKFHVFNSGNGIVKANN